MKSHSPNEETMAPSRLHILVVDDSAPLCLLIRHLLGTMRTCLIDEAWTGNSALDSVAQKSYDIIFVDHQLPDIDGLTLAQELQRRGVRGKLVLMTADKEVLGNLEANDQKLFTSFLPKPFTPDQLFRCVRDLNCDPQTFRPGDQGGMVAGSSNVHSHA